jgi:hypothetical protein
MLKQAVFLVGIILLSIIAGIIFDISKDGSQSIHNQTTSVMCCDENSLNKELEKEVCTFICREKTACIAGDVSGASCQCDSCALPNQLLDVYLHDASNYRCDAYCKKMKNCFDGYCKIK